VPPASGSPWADLGRPPLRAGALRTALTSGDAPSWRRLEVVAETGSTNADVAGWARAGEPGGAVLAADHQSAGRGRRERGWESPARAGLAVSVLLRPGDPDGDPPGDGDGDGLAVPPERWAWLGLLAGVALTDALTLTCGLEAVLKWPNDVLVPMDGRVGDELGKVAGVLAEVVRNDPDRGAGSAVVLGFGLNVSQDLTELPVPTATSLRLAGSASIDRDVVLRSVLRALATRYRAWTAAAGDPRAGLAAVYRERCATIGQPVRAHLPGEITLEGVAEGVDDAGRLLIRAGGSITALSAGDVVHIRPGELA
jgi:BirA family biotin operon repressor/biotin-[acetyl-CoA-carboxylase] ligase